MDQYLRFVAARARRNTVLAAAYDLKVAFTILAKDPRDVTAGDALAGPNGDAPKGRLGAGQLRHMVLDHLCRHPDQDFTPSAIGKLMVRSSGAISNALEKLAAQGLVTQTSLKPRRYCAAQ